MDERALSKEALLELAAQQGVHPTEEDAEAVLGFLRVLAPALRELEELIPPEVEP